MLRMPWHRISEVSPVASSFAYRPAARRAVRRPGVGDHPVQEHDAEDPQHPQLLADHRQDEVGLGLGQVVDLLHRLAQADAEQAARPERDLALDGLEAGRRLRRPTGSGTTSAARAGRAGRPPSARPSRTRSPPAGRGERIGIPAASSSMAIVNATTSIVPRSGSATISRQAGPATVAIGATAWRNPRIRLGWSARYRATYRTSASFISSDGWNWIGPTANQRRAPLT